MERRRSTSMYELKVSLEAISSTPQGTESDLARIRTLNWFLHPLTVRERSRVVRDQLKQLQNENNQLLSLTAEQTEDVQQTRAWLADTKMLLAEKERSRLLAIDKCDKVREATRHIERCVKSEREGRLKVEEGLTKSELQKEEIEVEFLEEISFQDGLRARLETLEPTLEHVEWEVGNEIKNQEELCEVLTSRRQEEKEIKSLSQNLDIEKVQLMAEEMAHSSLRFQHKSRQELNQTSVKEIEDLKQKIAEKRKEISYLQNENAGLSSFLQGQKTKVGLFQRFREWLSSLNCLRSINGD